MTEERRLVTILFADVVGSTALSESLDPEDVRALLGRLFTIARDAVERHGGRVEKFIGDAVMAVFGLPIAHDDDAARALSAALDLRDRVRDDPDLGERLAIRLGVHSGEVIATRDQDAQEFLITGDPVNTAARLQQAADAWTILVGERTVRAVSDRFIFGEPLAIEAKGKANPVPARPLVGPAAANGRAVRRRIVGREADLAQLNLTANRSFQERRPFLITIVAAAGVGKSRLLEEFLDRLDPNVKVVIAQCLPYGQRLTYWPMRAILLSIVGLADDATPDGVRDGLTRWLRGAGEVEPERIADLLAATIGAAEAESGDRIALFAAWRRFVELAAEQSPLVLIIEDLHWSSDSLLDLVESILQPRADVPMLMIALARPELLDRRPSWGGGRRNAVSIALDPLPAAAVAELVADLLDNPAPAIVDAVVERAEGNPFYAGEIVRSLSDRLGENLDPDAVTQAIAALPDTVQATVLARLDGLEPTARRIVQLGAVLGRAFQPRALPALEPGLSEAELAAATDALIERDLVRRSGRGLLTFRHILIREVAYGTLPRRERARLHAAAGGWLESEATASGREDELAELVAFHLREAANLGSLLGQPPAPELVDRAVRWLRRAADAAAAGAATVEAAHHLDVAIALAPTEAQPELYERLGQIWVGGEQGLAAFERANILGNELGRGADHDLRTLAQAVIVAARWIGSVGTRLGDVEVERRFARLRVLVGQSVSDRARLLGYLALAFGPAGARNIPAPEILAEAEVAAQRALELARRLDDADLVSAALDAYSVVAMGDDRVDQILGFVRQRREIADRLTVGERIDAWIMTAWMQAVRGELEESEQAAAQARAGLGSGQAASWALGASAWRTFSLHALGRWDDALAEAVRAERSWAESETRAPWFALNGFLAAFAICRSRADPEEAGRWRAAATTIFERSDPSIRTQRMAGYLSEDLAGLEAEVVRDFRVFTGRYDYVHLAMSLLADRDYPIAAEALDAIIDYTEPRGIALVSASARRLRGLARRDPSDLQAALASYAAMSAIPLVARVRTELGLLTGDRELMALGVGDLEAIGDVEQASRVSARARAGWPSAR